MTQAKALTDTLYEAMKEAGYRWDGKEFGFHYSRVQNMLKNDNPTPEELEALPDAFVELYPFTPKADAPKALRELRRQGRRREKVSERDLAPDARLTKEERTKRRTENYDHLFDLSDKQEVMLATIQQLTKEGKTTAEIVDRVLGPSEYEGEDA
jgi:hypothetical protein